MSRTLCQVFDREERTRRGRLISRLRLACELSQDDAAQSLGVSRSTLSNWELGRRGPNAAMWLRISYLYKVSIDFILNAETIRFLP